MALAKVRCAGRLAQSRETADVIQVRMRENDAFYVVGGLAQAGDIIQDLLVAARQARVNQREAVCIDDQVWVGDHVGDDEYVVCYLHRVSLSDFGPGPCLRG